MYAITIAINILSLANFLSATVEAIPMNSVEVAHYNPFPKVHHHQPNPPTYVAPQNYESTLDEKSYDDVVIPEGRLSARALRNRHHRKILGSGMITPIHARKLETVALAPDQQLLSRELCQRVAEHCCPQKGYCGCVSGLNEYGVNDQRAGDLGCLHRSSRVLR